MNYIKKLRGESVMNYILFVWMQEDLVRSNGMDIEAVVRNVIKDSENGGELRDWYENLILMLENEGKREKGHSQFVVGLTDEVNQLHLTLLKTPEYVEYNTKFYKVLPLLAEFRRKNGCGAEVNDVELLITAMYGVILLRLSGKEVGEDTLNATKEFASFANELSGWFVRYEKGELKFE